MKTIKILLSLILVFTVMLVNIGSSYDKAYAKQTVYVPSGETCPPNYNEVPRDPNLPPDPTADVECEAVAVTCPEGQKNQDNDITKCESIIVDDVVESNFTKTDWWQCTPQNEWQFLSQADQKQGIINETQYVTVNLKENKFVSKTGEAPTGRCNPGDKIAGVNEIWVSIYQVTYKKDVPPTPPDENSPEWIEQQYGSLPSSGGDRYVLPPTPVVPAPTFPSWFTELGESIDQKKQDYTKNDGTQSKALFDLGDSTSLGILFTNVPSDGIVNLSDKEYRPELSVKNNNNVFQFPVSEVGGNVTQVDLTKLWKQYTDGGNILDIFIYEVKDPSTLPQDVNAFFSKPKAEFKYYNTVTNNANSLTDFKITKSGYYVLGAKLKSGAREYVEVRGIKVFFSGTNGWLPISNDLISQIGEHVITTSWTKGDHDMGDLHFDSYKSLKVPSNFNSKHEIIAVGSTKGIKGIKLFNRDLTTVAIANPISDTTKVTKILAYEGGFLVSSYNNGLYYVDLNEKKSFKITGVGSESINDMFIEKGNIYIATNAGIETGVVSFKKDNTNTKIVEVIFTKSKSLSNMDVFSSNNEIGTIEVMLNKIVVSPKIQTTNSVISIIDKF